MPGYIYFSWLWQCIRDGRADNMPCEFRAALCLLLLVAAPPACPAEPERRSDSVVVDSPDGRLRVELFTRAAAEAPGRLQYRVSLSDRLVIDASGLGARMKDGTVLGRDSVIVGAEPAVIDSSFEQYPGKRRHVTDRANEVTVTLRERAANALQWQLVLRAYDDGVALRYRFPAQPDWQDLELADELTEFAFPAGAVATVSMLASFTTSHEARYERRDVDGIPANRLLALPLLVELPGLGWAAVLEANLADHAGMYLERARGPGGRLVSRLSPRPDEPKVAVRAALPHESPWRLVLIGTEARQLLESDTVLKLNAPSVIQDVSWIRPGKTTFPWWNDYFDAGVPFRMGLNTETAKYYIDFCAEYGIPYHTLDGVNGQAWYGGPIVPYEGADITRGIDGLDLQEVIAYARQKGVRIRLWMHWQAARRHMARAFPLYRAWGIEGVMIDFMDRDDQEMVNFQRELLQLAADNHLTVTFHGVAAPTGLERTFPNLLNSEAVLNLEHNKWDERGVTPEHDVTVPLTRMLAGPLDYHQGSLRGVPSGRFEPRVAAPLVIGTPVRMLASYVVFQNHLPMMADYPSAYRRHPLTQVLAEVPATWDDTRALTARVGEEVAIARRSGNDWWIGAMTDGSARDVRLSLSFLPPGMFLAEIWRDDPAADFGYRRETRELMPPDELGIRLAEAGGALVRLTLVPEPPPTVAAWPGVTTSTRSIRTMGIDRLRRNRQPAHAAAGPLGSACEAAGRQRGFFRNLAAARRAFACRGRDRHHEQPRRPADDHVERVSTGPRRIRVQGKLSRSNSKRRFAKRWSRTPTASTPLPANGSATSCGSTSTTCTMGRSTTTRWAGFSRVSLRRCAW